MLKSFLRSGFNAFKQGLDLATDSFNLIFGHPALLIYYALLLSMYTGLFVLAYNIIGYHATCMHHAHEFQILHTNLLENAFAQVDWLCFISLLGSFFLAILLHNLAGAALIKHAHALLSAQNIAISEVLKATKAKFKTILLWTALLTLIILGVQATALSIAIISTTAGALITSLALIAWSTANLFVLPIIILQDQSLPKAIKTSLNILLATLWQIFGGILWLLVLYLLALGLINLVYLLPLPTNYLAYAAIFVLNGLFSQAFLIFKTKLYKLYMARQAVAIDNQSSIDFSQF